MRRNIHILTGYALHVSKDILTKKTLLLAILIRDLQEQVPLGQPQTGAQQSEIDIYILPKLPQQLFIKRTDLGRVIQDRQCDLQAWITSSKWIASLVDITPANYKPWLSPAE